MANLTLEKQRKKEVHDALKSGDKIRIWKTMTDYKNLVWKKKSNSYQNALKIFTPEITP